MEKLQETMHKRILTREIVIVRTEHNLAPYDCHTIQTSKDRCIGLVAPTLFYPAQSMRFVPPATSTQSYFMLRRHTA